MYYFKHCFSYFYLLLFFYSSLKVLENTFVLKDFFSIFLSRHLRSSHQRCSMKKCVLRNFAKFTRKHLCHATLLKERLWHRCFPVNFAKFLRTLVLQNTSGRPLLPSALNYFTWNRFFFFTFYQNYSSLKYFFLTFGHGDNVILCWQVFSALNLKKNDSKVKIYFVVTYSIYQNSLWHLRYYDWVFRSF